MNPFLRRLAPALLLLAVPLGALFGAAANPLPIELFFDSTSIRQMALSPDGNRIAMVAPSQGGRYSLALLDTTTGKLTVPAGFSDENIRGVFWKGNDRLLFTSTVEGHEIPLLASVDLSGRSMKRLLESRRSLDDFSLMSGGMADRFPSSPEHILIVGYTDQHDGRKMNPSIPRGTTGSIYKVNVKTARRTMVVGLDRGTSPGWVDSEGNQRLTTVSEGREVSFKIRERNDHPWRTIKTFPSTDVRWEVRTLLADGQTAYFTDYTEQDRGELKTLDLLSGKISPPVFTPPEGEIVGVITSPKRDRVLGVAYESAKSHVHWLDARWKSIAQTLDSQFPDNEVSIFSISDDEKRFLFVVSSDRNPGQYFLGDLRGDALQAQFISAVRPAIKPDLMSAMTPVQFAARDGLAIHGYLTRPAGLAAEAKPPLLVMPHGGPFGIRDSWGFNNEIQFLANRGYAVLQVNYRGSGGYGRSFEHAGYLEWGGKMQDDLTDAVKWAVSQGFANPAYVGIIGASYGGYAALAGVTLTPELYQVGINYVGVSDLRIITRYDLQTDSAAIAYFSKAVGRDPALLAARSPVDHVANIRVPTLHAYGRNDPRVRFENWEVLEKALKKHGKTYEIIIEDKEGHGFEKEETALRYYRTVEAFLQKYMPAGNTSVK